MDGRNQVNYGLNSVELNLASLATLYEEKRYGDVIEKLRGFPCDRPEYIPALLLMAKAHLEMKEFKESEKSIDKALRMDPSNPNAVSFKRTFLEVKFKALIKGGTEFLKKGLELGAFLGQSHFEKAVLCLEQALEISPKDPVLLDHVYTAYQFLGLRKKASETRSLLYSVDPNFKTMFDGLKTQGLCFLAGYAYQENEAAISDFKAFRRKILLPSLLGRRLVTLYARWSPMCVQIAKQFGISPRTMRFLLSPFRFMASKFAAGSVTAQ
ncbi:hypothetical protein HYY75_06935, partial [bacterium]|nr:hypothetical protein [bacterium]